MKRLFSVVIALFMSVGVFAIDVQAMTVTSTLELDPRSGEPTGWTFFWVKVSVRESQLLHSQWGYNLELGRRVVDRIMSGMGAPRGFTATAAMAPAIGLATSKVGYDLWYWSIQNQGQAFQIRYRSNLAAAAEIRDTLGAVGDRLPAAEDIERIVRILMAVINSLVVD